MKKITKTWLKLQGVCKDHLKLFTELYPNGIEVCWKCFGEAQRKGLDVSWLMWHIANEPYREVLPLYVDAPLKEFPKLTKRFSRDSTGPWEINILPKKALQILEKSFLENDLDPLLTISSSPRRRKRK